MKILIIRHGDPDYSIDSLTEKGWREAELLKTRLTKLDVKVFYCSPLGRAQDTARPTLQALGRTAETCDWLREFDGYAVDDAGEKVHPWDRLPAFMAAQWLWRCLRGTGAGGSLRLSDGGGCRWAGTRAGGRSR